MLSRQSIRVGLKDVDRAEAIQLAGDVLVEIGAVEAAYVDAMHEREGVLSSYEGESFAIPHGTDASRRHIKHSALAFLQFPEGVDWEGEEVRACIAIRGGWKRQRHQGRDHPVARLGRNEPMTEVSRKAVVGSRVGLHSRPAKLVAQEAAKQSVIVRISKNGGAPVDARSLLSILALGAKKGDEVTLEAEGEGASTAIDAIAALVEQDLDEEPADA